MFKYFYEIVETFFILKNIIISIMSKKTRQRMTNEETFKLINARIKLDNLFTSKLFDKKEAWKKVKNVAGLTEFSVEQVKMKWGNLWKKYKDLLHPPTGRSTEDDGENAENWEFFSALHSFAASQHTVNPPIVIDSSSTNVIRTNPHNTFGGPDFEIENKSYTEVEYLMDVDENQSHNANSITASTSSIPDNNRPTTSTASATFLKKKKYSQSEMFEYFKRQEKRRKKESKAIFGILAAYAKHDNVNIPEFDLDESSDSD